MDSMPASGFDVVSAFHGSGKYMKCNDCSTTKTSKYPTVGGEDIQKLKKFVWQCILSSIAKFTDDARLELFAHKQKSYQYPLELFEALCFLSWMCSSPSFEIRH